MKCVKVISIWLVFSLVLSSCSWSVGANEKNKIVNEYLPITDDIVFPNSGVSKDPGVLYLQYFDAPLCSAITANSWENPNEIRPEFLVNFFAFKTNLGRLSWDDKPLIVPAYIVEPFIQKYFDVDSAHIQKSEFYNRDDDTYSLPLYSRGVAIVKMTNATLVEDILTIEYEFYSRGPEVKLIREGSIKLQIFSAGEYKYLSCETNVIE